MSHLLIKTYFNIYFSHPEFCGPGIFLRSKFLEIYRHILDFGVNYITVHIPASIQRKRNLKQKEVT
jgi:hypothetical protein